MCSGHFDKLNDHIPCFDGLNIQWLNISAGSMTTFSAPT